jgi:hypothetical protein
MPCFQKQYAMLDYERPQAGYLMHAESMAFRQADRFEPKLRNIITMLNMNVRRLRSF